MEETIATLEEGFAEDSDEHDDDNENASSDKNENEDENQEEKKVKSPEQLEETSTGDQDPSSLDDKMLKNQNPVTHATNDEDQG